MMAQGRRSAFSFQQGPRTITWSIAYVLPRATRRWVTLLADATMFVIGSVAMLAAPAYFILQPWAAANLWPVPFLLFAPFGTFYLVILLVAARGRARSSG